jgi:hypothetical protein
MQRGRNLTARTNKCDFAATAKDVSPPSGLSLTDRKLKAVTGEFARKLPEIDLDSLMRGGENTFTWRP